MPRHDEGREWGVVEVETACHKCGGKTTVQVVGYQVAVDKDCNPIFAHDPERTKLPRKLCGFCRNLDYDGENDIQHRHNGLPFRADGD